MLKFRLSLAVAVFALFVSIFNLALAQGFDPFGGFNSFRGGFQQNEPPNTEVVIARLKYGTNGTKGHNGWSHNYPGSDQRINSFLARSTLIDIDDSSYRVIELGSDEIFNYPFAYVSEPGEMLLTDQEVINLREYILRGGTMIMDDFDGERQWAYMEEQVRRAFPDRSFSEVSEDHLIFNSHERLESLQAMSNYVPGADITYYGLYTDDGRLAIMAGHNNDLANFWDWYGNGSMPLKPSTDAFRLGTNALIYSITH